MPIVFLDYDGVIVDSVELKTSSIIDAFRSFSLGGQHLELSVRQSAHLPRLERIRLAYENEFGFPIDDNLLGSINEQVLNSFGDLSFSTLPLVEDFLKKMSIKNSLILISSGDINSGMRTLDSHNLTDFFTQIYFDVPSKYKKFCECIANYESTPILSFGDTLKDAQVAHDLLIPYWHIALTPPAKFNFVDYSPDFCKPLKFAIDRQWC